MAKKESTKKTSLKEAKDPRAARLDALAQAMGRIEKAYGRGAIMKLGDESIENVEVIPSGSVGLDYALGVGEIGRAHV